MPRPKKPVEPPEYLTKTEVEAIIDDWKSKYQPDERETNIVKYRDDHYRMITNQPGEIREMMKRGYFPRVNSAYLPWQIEFEIEHFSYPRDQTKKRVYSEAHKEAAAARLKAMWEAKRDQTGDTSVAS